MKNKKFKIFSIFLLILAVFLFLGLSCQKKEEKKEKEISPRAMLSEKKIILVIAFQNYQDSEYSKIKEVLERNGAKITLASSQKGEAKGTLGGSVLVEKTLEEISSEEYDGLIFIGGPGAEEYFGNKTAHLLAKEAIEKNKILGAICLAPVILAKAGVLDGRKATVWSSFIDKSSIEELEKNGSIYIDKDVIIDGKIVTANGPAAAQKFGQAIINLLK